MANGKKGIWKARQLVWFFVFLDPLGFTLLEVIEEWETD